jgi:serine/threonine protein kinase/Tol biopolymer transport system component
VTDTGHLTGILLGRYRVGTLIGRGGMGDVYRADDTDLHRPVALKVLPQSFVADPDRLARFVQEARSASSVSHPNLVAIHDVGAAAPAGSGDKVHFIAMELVDGQTLRTLLAHDTRDLRKMLDYCIQAAEALSAAHAAGVVHRDVKPENLMIASGGYLKVLDFGLAKLRLEPSLLHDAAKETTVAAGTEPGLMLGTVGYMAPEQAQGRPVDHRSDIFAFGCVLYEVASGARAFSGASAVDTLHRILHADPAPLTSRVPGLPSELQRIVSKCLAKDPDERYQSMKEVAIDLRSLRRQLDSGVSGGLTVPPPRRARWWIAAAAIAVLAAGLAAAVTLWRNPEPASAPDSLTIARLTASGLVIDAVLSPDGKYLAYVESSGGFQSLHLRQIGGGRTIELVPPARMGYWGIAFARDGQSIMYGWKSSEHPAGTLYQVPVLGGRPREILTNFESAMTFSPDGTRMAFYRFDPAERTSAIVNAAVDGSDQRVVIAKRPPAFYVPGFFAAPSWSPDGAAIAAVVRDSRSRDARLTLVDVSTGVERVFPERYQEASFAAWLPDGSGIAITGRRPGMHTSTGNGGQIFIQPYPSGPVRRITNDMIEYRNISFSGDGRQMVSVGFDVQMRMLLMPMAGGEPRFLGTERYDGGRGVAWTPDGSRLVFNRVIAGKTSIASMRLDGNDVREMVNDDGSSWPAVSPDGKTLAYFATRGAQTGVWRSDLDGGNVKLLAELPDANGIVFAPDGESLVVSSQVLGPAAALRVPAAGGEPKPIALRMDRPALSPDGRLVAGTYRAEPSGPLQLAVLTSDTGAVVHSFPLESTAIGGSTGWTADGSAVLYTTIERYNVWKRPLAGGEPEKVTRFSDLAIFRFAVSPDGKTLAICRGSQNRDAFLFHGFN